MILAYSVYLFLLVLMLICARANTYLYNCNCTYRYWNATIFLPIIFFAFLLGTRYNVGIDYLNYYDKYADLYTRSFAIDWEPAFVLIYYCGHLLHAPPAFIFMVIAFIQITVFYKIFEDKVYLLPYGVLLLFISCHIFGMLNTLRQDTAILILLLSVRYVVNQKFWAFLLCVVCASLFHFSAIVFLPVSILFFSKKWTFLDNPWIQFLVYLLCVLCHTKIYNFLIELFVSVILNKEGYNLPLIGGIWQITEGTGYGRILNDVVFVGLIFFNRRLYHSFGIAYLQHFRIFYIGKLLLIVAGLDMNMRRLAGYYSVANLIVLSYLFCLIYSKWKILPIHFKVFSVFIFCIYSFLFIYKIYVGEELCSPFQFIF